MSIKLSKDIRTSIAKKCLDAQFKVESEAMNKEESKLALKLYKSLFPAKLLKQAAEMPKDWIRYDSCLKFNCNGYSLTFNVAEAVPVPKSDYCRAIGAPAYELAEIAQDFARKKEAFKEKQQHAARALLSMLESINTTAQLEKAWIEGKPFYEKYLENKNGATVPAVQVADVNSLLGL